VYALNCQTFNKVKFMNNYYYSREYVLKRKLRKLILIMNLTALMSVFLTLNLGATVYSQNTKFNLSVKNKTVREVFQILEKDSKFRFFYNDGFKYIDNVVDLDVKNKNVEQILEKLFEKSDITYKVLENNLVVLTLKQNLQQAALTGKIIDATTGEPLPGVNVTVKGTTRGTITDLNGVYSIETTPGEILIFSYIGYIIQEIEVGEQTELDLKLMPDVESIDEVVVVGYGTMKKSAVTGAISAVSSKEVTQLPAASIESALQGLASGVSVVNAGAPGTDPIVRIRGNGSISYQATPLYVVDGFPTTDLRSFDAKDIQSIEILKDASASAIYGSRGANGVILITTKKGNTDGKVHVDFNAYLGVQSLPKKLDLLDRDQYVEYANLMAQTTGTDIPSRLEPENFNQPIYEGAGQTFAQTETNWQDELFTTAPISEQNLAISLSNDKSVYYSSIGHFNQDGIMIGTGYQRLNFRFNSEHQLSKRIKFGQTLFYSTSDREDEKRSQGRSNVMHMIRSVPYMPVEDPTRLGGYIAPDNSDGTDPDNPVKVQKLFKANTYVNKLFGTIYLDLKITDWLSFKSTAGMDKSITVNKSGEPIYYDGFNGQESAVTRRRNEDRTSLLFTNQLTFNKNVGDHSFNIVAVAEQQSNESNLMYISGNLSTNAVDELTGLSNITANGKKEENLLLSYLGRLNYNFKEKYLVSAAIRADGSSKLSTNNKWGYFPSASIGWKISQEAFMENLNSINLLKLRAGIGVVGFNGIGNYEWQSLILANSDYILNNSTVETSYFNAISNPDLKWEESTTINVGVDLAMLDNKFTFSADYFHKLTNNLILAVPYSPSLGYTADYFASVGEMVNQGVDIEAGYWISVGNLKSKLSGNLSIVRNEVLHLATPSSTIYAGQHSDFGGGDITRTIAGDPIQSFYGWEVEGIFQSDAEVASAPVQTPRTDPNDPATGTSAGDIRFKDQNHDGVINSEDRTFLGSYLPKFSYGLIYSGNYKNFDFNLFFQGVYGNKIYNGTKVISEGMVRLFNSDTEVLNAWRSDHKNTDIPRAISGDPNGNVRTSDRFIEDGTYLRLKTISVGYTLPENLIGPKSGATPMKIRVYVSAINLLTFTKYTGYDPEVGAQIPTKDGRPDYESPDYGLTEGIDKGFNPTPRTFMGGIQINF
jgi:TonB-dependent starch-binding outer membrane protein SusC